MIPFRSRNELHKYPFGAIKAGAGLTLRVVLPRSMCCRGVMLAWGDFDGAWANTQPLDWAGMQGEHEEWWQCRLTVHEAGLLRYRFAYESDHGPGVIGHVGEGIGRIGANGWWQLTVYDPAMKLPDWVKNGVLYQIFPDRFHASLPSGNWGETPQWAPDEQGRITSYDFFGGDLAGIAQKLDYLQSLGVTCIYLNPIFKAQSNHRYDTEDYMQIDPLLGSEGDFKHLCEQAHARNMKIILDGVFSHTGKKSIYFEQAQLSQQSPYYEWYDFTQWPDEYASWWGIDILPELREDHPAVLAFFTGEDGVVRHWLRAGADGWRLDVADELPDIFLDQLFHAAQQENPDSYVLGEVWEDASCKHSHGGRRRFLLGGQMHSVMNYPLAEAILRFAKGRQAEQLAETVLSQQEHYPPDAVAGLMNHIGTHDTPRILNRLVSENIGREPGQLSPAQYSTAKQKLKLCAALQYTLPGNPCVYYGDEAGLVGGADPFNRACYPWENEDRELLAYYRMLGQLRKEHDLSEFQLISAAMGCIAYQSGEIIVIANANAHGIVYTLPQEHAGAQVLFGGEISGCDVRIDAEEVAICKTNMTLNSSLGNASAKTK